MFLLFSFFFILLCFPLIFVYFVLLLLFFFQICKCNLVRLDCFHVICGRKNRRFCFTLFTYISIDFHLPNPSPCLHFKPPQRLLSSTDEPKHSQQEKEMGIRNRQKTVPTAIRSHDVDQFFSPFFRYFIHWCGMDEWWQVGQSAGWWLCWLGRIRVISVAVL